MLRFKVSVLFLLLPASVSSQEPSWSLVPGTSGFAIADIGLSPSNPDSVYVTGAGKLLLSTDGGLTWDSLGTGACCGVIAVDAHDPATLLLNETGTPFDGNALWRSTDHGAVWEELHHGFCTEELGCSAPFLTQDPSDPSVVYASVNPWFLIRARSAGLITDTIPVPEHLSLWSVAVSHQDPSVLYAAYATPVTLFRSDDLGLSWSERPIPGLTAESSVLVAVHPGDDNIVYAAVDGFGVYKSVDGGLTWAERNSGLDADQLDVGTILINPHNPDELFLGIGDDDPFDGVSDMLVVSVDGADSWTSFSEGLPLSGRVNHLAMDPRAFRLFATVVAPLDSFVQAGVYLFDTVTHTASVDSSVRPGFILESYPNPFNSSTTIRYGTEQAGPVRLVLYDILGRRVTTVLEGEQQAGLHSVRWDGSGLPTGAYFIVLEAGRKTSIRRVLLLR